MDYDVLIIGSGPAGQHAAWQAARMGKRAAIVERKPRIGGAGLQTGTIPSKAMREMAYLLSRSGQGGMAGRACCCEATGPPPVRQGAHTEGTNAKRPGQVAGARAGTGCEPGVR